MLLAVWFAAALVFGVGLYLARWRLAPAERELEGLRQQFEGMVEDRTQELQLANEKLQSEIAERRLAEEAMRMLERAVEQSVDGILVADLDAKVQFLNAAWARMHGYEDFELLGRPLDFFHSRRQREEELRPCLERVRATGAFDGEVGHLRKDGTTFPTWTSVTLLRDPGECAVGFAVVCRDISERKRAEREQARLEAKIEQSKKLESLGALAGGIAHDYNNLLTGVLGNSSLVLRELAPASPAREKIRQIEAAAERAADLSEQLLAYAGEDPLVYRETDLSELVRDTADEIRRLLPANVELALELGEGLPRVGLDPAQVRRALFNLLLNASEALEGEPGTVRVRTRRRQVEASELVSPFVEPDQPEGEYVSLEVSDTGCGLGEETRIKMFDPFYSTRASARGLGLATVFGIMRAHGGAIQVASEPGRGATFELLFARAPRPPAAAEPPAEAPALEASGTILVIDDEALMREVSESILEEVGFRVLTAADGPTGLEIFRRERAEVRLVLLDRTMPAMDGGEVLREVCAIDPRARVVLMSGYKEKEALRGLERHRLSGFLQKPFRPEDLLRKVREALSSPPGLAGDRPAFSGYPSPSAIP